MGDDVFHLKDLIKLSVLNKRYKAIIHLLAKKVCHSFVIIEFKCISYEILIEKIVNWWIRLRRQVIVIVLLHIVNVR